MNLVGSFRLSPNISAFDRVVGVLEERNENDSPPTGVQTCSRPRRPKPETIPTRSLLPLRSVRYKLVCDSSGRINFEHRVRARDLFFPFSFGLCFHESFVARLHGVDPDDEVQLLALVGARDFPTPGSRDNYAGQHDGTWDKERVRHLVHYEWRSISVKSSSSDL